MSRSKIEWLARSGTIPESWNPVTGCTKISDGCKHCYAERMSKRLKGRFGYPEDDPFRVTLHEDKLDAPLHWKKPRTVFVCSMGDLFHEAVPFSYITNAWNIMETANRHTFMVLTKRPDRMLDYLTSADGRFAVRGYMRPLPNLWLGVTAENQARADERIPLLLQCPAAVRFVSIEPMLSELDLRDPLYGYPEQVSERTYVTRDMAMGAQDMSLAGMPMSNDEWAQTTPALDWIIVGAETGPGARPMDPDWARSVRDQCASAGVPFFMKAMSNGAPIPPDLMVREWPERTGQ